MENTFQTGDRVTHRRYGVGTVIERTKHLYPNYTRVTFDDGVTVRLMTQHLTLENG